MFSNWNFFVQEHPGRAVFYGGWTLAILSHALLKHNSSEAFVLCSQSVVWPFIHYIKLWVLAWHKKIFYYYFFNIFFFFWCGPFLKSLFNMLQYCSCFMFCCFGWEAYGILAPRQGMESAPPALEGEVPNTGPPEKSQEKKFKFLVWAIAGKTSSKIGGVAGTYYGFLAHSRKKKKKMLWQGCLFDLPLKKNNWFWCLKRWESWIMNVWNLHGSKEKSHYE